MDSEAQPLIGSPLSRQRTQTVNVNSWFAPYVYQGVRTSKEKTRAFLSSKAGHYSILALVAVDVSLIFANFLISLFSCEKRFHKPYLDDLLDTLDVVSLVFSCLFMAELLASVWAFGWHYFHSYFHCFDAFIIVSGLIMDIVLKGDVEEAASLIVALRLWRVFKIFEELAAGAQEQMSAMATRIQELEMEIKDLKRR